METSALDSSNVAAAFETVAKEIYNIMSRKMMSSHEISKQDRASLSNGKKVVIPSEAHGESKKGCLFLNAISGTHIYFVKETNVGWSLETLGFSQQLCFWKRKCQG